MAIHKNLSDSELHEPKGVASAATLQVYVADGAGSGAWRQVALSDLSDAADVGLAADVAANEADIDTAQAEANLKLVSVPMTGIDSGITYYIGVDRAYQLVSAHVVLYAAITVADETITISDGSGSHGSVTIDYTTSGAGVMFENTLDGLAVDANRVISVTSAGTSTGPADAVVTLLLRAV